MAKKQTRKSDGILRVPVPETRDPFINTPLISLGPAARGRSGR